MRSYLNGSGNSGTPPPALGRPLPRPGLMMGRASSSSLPRSPENDSSFLTSGLGTGSGSLIGSTSGQSGQGSLLGSNQSGQGSLGSHSSHDVSYMNIYQNTNHPHLYVSRFPPAIFQYLLLSMIKIKTNYVDFVNLELLLLLYLFLQSLKIFFFVENELSYESEH